MSWTENLNHTRYPDTIVYAVPALEKENGAMEPNIDKDGGNSITAKFSAALPPDLVLLGFQLPVNLARNHFFVFAERVGKARLGYVLQEKGGNPKEGSYCEMRNVYDEDADKEYLNSAVFALDRLQDPVRVFVNSTYLPPEDV